MILRRLKTHIEKENWFAVFIDFCIVVIGVFVGLQVANWHEERVNEQRSNVFLGALLEDIQADIIDMDVTIAVETARISALDHLIVNATGKTLPDGFDSARGRVDIVSYAPYSEADSFDLGYSLFIMNYVPSRRAAYETIINSGGLELINGADLLREIQTYYARVESIQNFEDIMQSTRERFVEVQRRFGISPIDDQTMDGLVELFDQNKADAAAASEFWLFTNYHLRLLHDHLAAAEQFSTQLEQAVSK